MRSLLTLTVLSSLLGVASLASASSHREAPAITEDPYADNTDVYAFISPEDPNRVVLIANWVPFLQPASGPNFWQFSDDVLYQIRLDNDGDAIPDIAYEFDFTTTTVNPDTFLYNTGQVTSLMDEHLNVRQSYTITRRDMSTGLGTVVATDVPAAPWDVGRLSFPDYAAVADMAERSAGATMVFAGPRREAFRVDLNVFDLLGVGPQAMRATPPLMPNYLVDRYNVMSIALSVPITDVAAGGVRPTGASPAAERVVGVYALSSRRQVRIIRRQPDSPYENHLGPWVQVSRLGLPLVNEVLIPRGNKNDYLRTDPVNDAALYGMTILNPELNPLLRALIPELGCTPTPAGGNPTILSIITAGGTVAAADLLRLNITAGQTFADTAFPNGRTLRDDVFTAEVNVICTTDPTMPVAPGVISGPVAPGIMDVFPYMPLPIRPD
ncbi:MAG: DUF4331 domain-containing protein [Myxococcota bacterium]|nr:DUF4331 domain-containing protein [Myxococcota bacterium]